MSDPARKRAFEAINPPLDAIKIWRGPSGWSVFFPEGAPPEAQAEITAAVERLNHAP